MAGKPFKVRRRAMTNEQIARELVEAAKCLVAAERKSAAWAKEAVAIEKAIGRAISKNVSEAVDVWADGYENPVKNARVTIYGGQIERVLRKEIKGWKVDLLNGGTLEIGLRRE
jgi:hypothetical protein